MKKTMKKTMEIKHEIYSTITPQWIKAFFINPKICNMKKDYRGPGDKKDSPKIKYRPMTPPAALNIDPMAPSKAKRKYTPKK